ncbi:unnamed protein product [Prunus armeniaca]
MATSPVYLLQWRSNTSARFHELMSQVFENCEGENDENTEKIVELFADETQENTSTSAEEKDDEVEETATLPSSSKFHYNCMHGKLSLTELRTLKHEFQTIKDELAKVASSNRALRKRVRDLEESLKHKKECQKNTKCVEDFSKTLASMEHYFTLEI